MHLGDVRRLLVSASLLAVAFLLWLFWLGIAARGEPTGITGSALNTLALSRWLWVGNVAFVLVLLVATGLLFLMRQAPRGYARGIMRQVQCQDCKAVFMVHDTGHRPITHVCPNCKALGVYDGRAPPVGQPPRAESPRRIVALGLSCQQCNHGFQVTDTGARPLRVRCPACRADGLIR